MTKGGQSSQSLPDDDLRYTLRPWEAGATFEMLRLHTERTVSCVFDKGKKTGRSPDFVAGNAAPCAAPDGTPLFMESPNFWQRSLAGV